MAPEVLFDVAKQWLEIYERLAPKQQHHTVNQDITVCDTSVAGSMLKNMDMVVTTSHQSQSPIVQSPNTVCSNINYQIAPPTVQYSVPYSLAAFNYGGVLHPQYANVAVSPPLSQVVQLVATPNPNFQMPPTAAYGGNMTAQGLLSGPPPSQFYPVTTLPTGAGLVNQSVRISQAAPTLSLPLQPHFQIPLVGNRPPVQTQQPPMMPSVLAGQQQTQPSQVVRTDQISYVLAAFRVGMFAMETLARKVHDDRPQAKYARCPSYGDDVKWLLSVAKKLGTHYLHQFCMSTVSSVVSPFVLQDIANDVHSYLSQNGNPPALNQQIRNPILYPLVQKCQQMYIQCTHSKLFHITNADYDDFINILLNARAAFQMTAGGLVQFNELLQSLRRSKSFKKDLWMKLNSALNTKDCNPLSQNPPMTV